MCGSPQFRVYVVAAPKLVCEMNLWPRYKPLPPRLGACLNLCLRLQRTAEMSRALWTVLVRHSGDGVAQMGINERQHRRQSGGRG